jgi:hypothetical protein
MVLPALAAGATRAAAVSGRAAAGASRATGATAKSSGRATRSASQMKSQFQQARMLGEKDQNDRDDQEGENGLPINSRLRQLQEAQEQMQMTAGSQMTQFKKATSMMRTLNAMRAASQEQTSKTQDAAKQVAKKMIPKMALFMANAVSTTLEVGTGGVAFLFTFFIRFVTLGWYNAEMIYGGWIMKGKHKLIGPLTWDPLPLPFPKNKTGNNALTLTIIVIILDAFVIMLMMLPILIMGTIVALVSSIF